MSAAMQTDAPKSRRSARMEKGWAPVVRQRSGGYAFAHIDVRELELIASLKPRSNTSSAVTVLCWLKTLAKGNAQVAVTDLELAWRANLSFNTITKAAAILCRAGVVIATRGQGKRPVYSIAFPLDTEGS